MATSIRFAPSPTPADTYLGMAPWILLTALWVFIGMIYTSLPAEIPTHFDAWGVADGSGPKSGIFMLVAVFTGLVFLVSLLILFPRAFNYPVRVTTENAAALQRLGIRLLRSLKLSVTLVAWIAVLSMAYGGLGIWTVPLVLLLVFVPLGYYLAQMLRLRPS
jgi:uncharacterized membrane protein